MLHKNIQNSKILIIITIFTTFFIASCSNLDVKRNDTDFYQDAMTVKGNKPGKSISLTDRITDMFSGDLSVTSNMSITYEVALKQFSIMPLVSADKAGGTIITDWFSASENPEERFKFNIFIINENMEESSVNITMFKEKFDGSIWKPITANDNTTAQIKKLILEKSRQLKATADLS